MLTSTAATAATAIIVRAQDLPSRPTHRYVRHIRRRL
jgi:hypothetical protein